MTRRLNAALLAVVIVASLLVARSARAQSGSCVSFGEWIQQQGGTVYFVEPSFTAGFCIIGFYLYGQGASAVCQCG